MLKLSIQEKNPRKIGQIHGETFRKEIRELSEIRKGLLREYLQGWSWEDVEVLSKKMVRRLKDFPDLFEEFVGLSEASQISEAELTVLNNYTDIRDFSKNKQDAAEDGCSVFAVKNHRTNLCGQTWDMHASARPYAVQLSFPDAHFLTVVGCLALTGVNSFGVSVFINNMHCSETNENGLMWPALVREMLKQTSAQEALKVLRTVLPCSAHNYLVCDRKEMFNIEATGQRFEVTSHLTQKGTIFHTNHFVGELKGTEILSRQSPTTHQRYVALQNYLGVEQEKTKSEIFQELFQKGQTAKIILIPKPNEPHGGATCGGMTVDYQKNEVEFFDGLYEKKDRIVKTW